MQIGLNNLWTSGIQGCEDGIQFLEKNGYTCLTSLNDLNNPFWGSNPNETLAWKYLVMIGNVHVMKIRIGRLFDVI